MSGLFVNRIAAIANLDLAAVAMEELINRQDGLPGMGVLYGPSGWGKTTAALAIANRTRAYFVRVDSTLTRKELLAMILFEMGVKPEGSTSALLNQVCEQLAASQRPLILDEFDHVAEKKPLVELVRDIHDKSLAAILMVGEEDVPRKLKRYERFHGRVLSWLPAAPVSQRDARKLTDVYCSDIQVSDDLIAHLVELSHGSVRRVSNNLSKIRTTALVEGWSQVDRVLWGARPLDTGDAPRRGKAA